MDEEAEEGSQLLSSITYYSSSSSSDDEDITEFINYLTTPRRVRIYRSRNNHFLNWDEVEFYDRFRLTKSTAYVELEQIRHEIKWPTTRWLWRGWCACSALVLLAAGGAPRPPRPPHVLLIMLDDMGWNDVSFHGSDQILTPNIDALAYDGVILQQYYSEAVCTPARSALLTGKYPMRLGMHGQPLLNAEHRSLPACERLLPARLAALGYQPHLVGKWHVGMSSPAALPTRRGYSSHYGMRGGFVDYYTYNKVETGPDGRQMFGLDLFDDDRPQDDERRYIVDALTARALHIIDSHNSSRSLFLHVAHNAPHAGNEGGALQPPLAAAMGSAHVAHPNRRLYAEVVSHLDRSVGRLVRALGERGMLRDTLIAFMSDNGAPTVGTFANWGVNLPFRGIKRTPWEGAVRVPAFVWHSSLTPRVWHGLMHVTDWLPTLVAAAGGRVDEQVDGVDQWEAIVRDTESKRNEVLVTIEDGEENAFAAYRAGDYKVVIGNVTGLRNDYYGADFLAVKAPPAPPDYRAALSSSDVARALQDMGKHLDYDAVDAMRRATAITQEDSLADATPCVPTPTKGCLFNVRRDPAERHDLWAPANKIARLLAGRLRALWAGQARRPPPDLRAEADPANFGYRWWPWLDDAALNGTRAPLEDARATSSPALRPRPAGDPAPNSIPGRAAAGRAAAARAACDGPTSLRTLLCVLRSMF